MAVKSHSAEPIVLNLVKKGIGEVTAADFEKNADVEIINKDLKIATITDKDYTFDLEVIINQGRGYVPVGEKDTKNLDLGTIAIDSLYTPIRDVGYKVENTRVGDVTDYEKLTLNIETNGTITPKDAIAQTTKILMDHFTLILDATGSASGSGDLEEINMEVEESDGDKKKEKKEKKAKKKTAKKTK